jgi:transcription antitermination factor NusG
MAWFLARIRARIQETAEHLGAYYPVVERVTRPGRKRKPVVSRVPVLPGTLIVDLEWYYEALSLPNVRGSVKVNKKLLILGGDDMERLHQIEEENRIRPLLDRPKPELIFNNGDEVKVITGCFIGQLGVIDCRVDRFSYQVLIQRANLPMIFNSCLLAHH